MASPTNLTLEQARQIYTSLYGSEELAAYDAAWAKYGATVSADELVNTMKARGGIIDIGEWETEQILSGNSSAIGISAKQRYMVVGNPTDSNSLIPVTRKVPVNTTVTQTGKISAKAGLREAGTFALGTVVPAVAATSVGIWLGKKIDSTLYDLAPDFWDSHNMSSLNPDTWDSITSDDNSLSARLFNTIFGIDEQGNTTAYMDEDAVAYLAWYLQTVGAFDTGTIDDADISTTMDVVDNLMEMSLGNFIAKFVSPSAHSDFGNTDYITTFFTNHPEFSPTDIGYLERRLDEVVWYRPIGTPVYDGHVSSVGDPYGYLSESLVMRYDRTFYSYTTGNVPGTLFSYNTNNTSLSLSTIANLSSLYGNRYTPRTLIVGTYHAPIQGMSNQDGATMPDTTGWSDTPSTKQSLQNQYPDTWNQAKHQDYVDEEGNQRSKTYIPIPLPDIFSDNHPTSGDSSQNRTGNNDQNIPDALVKTITDILTQYFTPGSPGTDTPSPTDTGSGDTGTTVMPVGQASSLWKIYNPTQAQVDSFGSWLWSSNFVEQIKKLFNDPMQGIIGIHKVFATPSIGGTATIKVGYLDSEVPSNWVNNQYTTIDCGTVKLNEVFGNVFDYSPYTKVSLYLPFIGIVDLDVADVMRASISVKYHVDVLSGACLADVKVSRDLAEAVLYQYSGSAIVTYPVSSGTYVGVLAGVASIATGAIAGVLTGGVASSALAVAGTATGLTHLHANVAHSGGFSGCAGAMASKKPYLIISRPITALAGSYNHFTGHPANTHVTLRECSGYTKVKSVYVEHMSSATDEEKDMIKAQLQEGVLI